MNLRTITCWVLYDPRRKQIIRVAQFKSMFGPVAPGFVLVKLKGNYVRPSTAATK